MGSKSRVQTSGSQYLSCYVLLPSSLQLEGLLRTPILTAHKELPLGVELCTEVWCLDQMPPCFQSVSNSPLQWIPLSSCLGVHRNLLDFYHSAVGSLQMFVLVCEKNDYSHVLPFIHATQRSNKWNMFLCSLLQHTMWKWTLQYCWSCVTLHDTALVRTANIQSSRCLVSCR